MACLNQNISAGIKNVSETDAVNKTTFHMLSPKEARELKVRGLMGTGVQRGRAAG
jgi:hypothetical protein